MSDLVLWEAADGVGRIILNRPEVSNAVDLDTAAAFGRAVDAAAADESVRVVHLSGAGSRFCAGGDVASMAAAPDRATYIGELADALDGVLQRLGALPKPVVVAVQGAVAGAGLPVMLTGDLIVAAASTKFVTGYVSVGLSPDCGISWLLPRTVGHVRAAELLLTGRTLDAGEAVEWGLVTRVVEDDTVQAEALALAQRLAAGPEFALGQVRRLLRESWTATRAESGADESRTIARAGITQDAQAAIARFAGR